MPYLAELQILLAIGVASLLGGLIGLEREVADKPAGLRTHIFVAASAAFLVALGSYLVKEYASQLGSDALRADPIRVIEAIITGVSFLGAGTIIRQRHGKRVAGLTTAASLLFTAAVGICTALGHYVLAVGASLGAIVTLRLVGWLEVRWGGDED